MHTEMCIDDNVKKNANYAMMSMHIIGKDRPTCTCITSILYRLKVNFFIEGVLILIKTTLNTKVKINRKSEHITSPKIKMFAQPLPLELELF